MIRVEISGPVSSGKTPAAQAVKALFESMEKKVFVSDNVLYSFKADVEKAFQWANDSGYDACILVVGTSGGVTC